MSYSPTQTIAAAHSAHGGFTFHEVRVTRVTTRASVNLEDFDPFFDNVVDMDWDSFTPSEHSEYEQGRLVCDCGEDLTGQVEIA